MAIVHFSLYVADVLLPFLDTLKQLEVNEAPAGSIVACAITSVEGSELGRLAEQWLIQRGNEWQRDYDPIHHEYTCDFLKCTSWPGFVYFRQSNDMIWKQLEIESIKPQHVAVSRHIHLSSDHFSQLMNYRLLVVSLAGWRFGWLANRLQRLPG